ncbi:CapA family protein [Vibrio cyclitrophicus]|uniref:CapA family protein n=1 Tax=Vibrio cyclitrophicus TaxID=47951 RepID=UPI0002DA5F46|nr:CapA family protein [Vibrio cyclitrophicus]OEF29287.1 hypothetical protein OA9_23620 [Vibrio cyclitrophicus 1F97]
MFLYGDVFLNKNFKGVIDFEEEYIFNLEAPVTNSFVAPAFHKVNLSIDNNVFLQSFKKMPYAVNLANNHIMDYGDVGFNDTVSFLNKNGIRYFGAGDVDDNFNNPLIVDEHGFKTAYFGYCCVSTLAKKEPETLKDCAMIDLEKIKIDIDDVKDKVDYIIISLHWGDEEVHIPKPDDVIKARTIIDFGADLILGHHAHVIQSKEIYKGKHIFYGLGNFIFPDFSVNALFSESRMHINYNKEQLPQNECSIEVNVDSNKKISYKKIRWINGSIVRETINLSKTVTTNSSIYTFIKNIYLKRLAIQGFIRRPRIPTLSNLTSFFRKY